jgi:hypothetical protein
MDYETIICSSSTGFISSISAFRSWIFIEYIPNLFLAIVATILIATAGTNGGFTITVDFYILLFTIPQIIYGGVPVIIMLLSFVIFVIGCVCLGLKEKSLEIIEDFENIKIRKLPVNLP